MPDDRPTPVGICLGDHLPMTAPVRACIPALNYLFRGEGAAFSIRARVRHPNPFPQKFCPGGQGDPAGPEAFPERAEIILG